MTIEYRRCEAFQCLAILASVAPRQSIRFLPGSVLVQVQPEARCGRGRWVRRFVADEVQAGSNPAVRSTMCPRSTKVVSQPRKLRVSVRFRPRARSRADRIADARAVQRVNAGVTCRRSLVRSQPCAPGRVLPAGQETGLSIQ